MRKMEVWVKPNSLENRIVSYDSEKNILRIEIKERADNGKANKELINFLKKYFKRRVTIISGFNSKKKIIRLE